MFTRKDFYFSVITGFITGFIAWRIFVFLKLPEFVSISHVWLLIFIPFLWILGVNLGYFLGRWMPFFNQFGKYAAIGFTNAAVYFGILNLLIYYTGIASGFWYPIFVTVAFIAGTVHSYIWNKYWAFEAAESSEGRREFVKFIVVSILAGLVNIGIASFVVNGLNPMFGLSETSWANIGGVAGSAIALIFSFIGFKMIVFKK